MRELDVERAIALLNQIMQAELSGVVRYTHYALMVRGPNRIPLVGFLQAQATESLTHAQQVGEIITGLEGHPSTNITEIEETHRHAIADLLAESLAHEEAALNLYKDLLDVVENASVYLEEFTRTMIGTEELHTIELRKMLRDYGG